MTTWGLLQGALNKSIHKKSDNCVLSLFFSLTHVPRERWNTGSSEFGCQASVVYSLWILSSGNPQTCCLCGRWLAASCKIPMTDSVTNLHKKYRNTLWIRNVRKFLGIINEAILSAMSWSRGDPYQLLLSTASPNPGVSTIVSSSWTPPSFIKTLDCSTWHRRRNEVHIMLISATNFNPSHVIHKNWHQNTQKYMWNYYYCKLIEPQLIYYT